MRFEEGKKLAEFRQTWRMRKHKPAYLSGQTRALSWVSVPGAKKECGKWAVLRMSFVLGYCCWQNGLPFTLRWAVVLPTVEEGSLKTTALLASLFKQEHPTPVPLAHYCVPNF